MPFQFFPHKITALSRLIFIYLLCAVCLYVLDVQIRIFLRPLHQQHANLYPKIRILLLRTNASFFSPPRPINDAILQVEMVERPIDLASALVKAHNSTLFDRFLHFNADSMVP